MSNTPDNPERDAALSAAWREHSAEMPPAELDAAILAAAHRAVGSAPLGGVPQAADKPAREAGRRTRAATGPQRWWMPLAAAATIGAIALGILQTAPPDTPIAPQSATDMPSTAPSAGQPASNLAPATESQALRDKVTAAGRKDTMRAESDARGAPAPQTRTTPQAAPTTVPSAPRAALTNVTPPPPAAPTTVAPAPAPASKPMPMADGKLTAPALAENEMSRKQTSAAAPPAVAPLSAAVPEPFPAEKKKDEATDALTMQGVPAPAAPAPARMAAAASDQDRPRGTVAQSPAAPADARQRFDTAQSPASSNAVGLAKTRSSAEAGAAKALDVDASLARIRKLHDEGKLADAAKELIALRATTPDADARLPPELRAWAATVKP